MENFDPGYASGLFALTLAPGRVELERVGHPVPGLFRDHVIGEVFGRQHFATREFRREAGDAAPSVVGRADEAIRFVVGVALGRAARGRA